MKRQKVIIPTQDDFLKVGGSAFEKNIDGQLVTSSCACGCGGGGGGSPCNCG